MTDRDACATHDHRTIESRQHLCGVIKGWARQGGTGYDTLADAILHSQWLAARDESVRSAALAPILALADEYQRHGRDGAGAEWFTVVRQLREACTPTATHDHDRAEPDPDYMCPNCVTPWKCNGPHIVETFDDELDDHIAESMRDPEYLAAHDRAVAAQALRDADLSATCAEHGCLTGRDRAASLGQPLIPPLETSADWHRAPRALGQGEGER